MKTLFYDTVSQLDRLLQTGECFTAWFESEESDFVRLNHNAIRQAGHVRQMELSLDWIHGLRHARGSLTLSGHQFTDLDRITRLVATLRSQVAVAGDDPHLLYSTTVISSESVRENQLPCPEAALKSIQAACAGVDLAGLYAVGGIQRGFANSFGQRNWFETHQFIFDWSLHHAADKAVKGQWAGFSWKETDFTYAMSRARQDLNALNKPARSIPPGRYRVYLAPAAMEAFVGMLGWGGFGVKSHRTKQTPLLRMIEAGALLNPMFTLRENTAAGTTPGFDASGFIKPDAVTLVDKGRLGQPLVSARSAKEFGMEPTGGNEVPASLEMDAGSIKQDDILLQIGTGVWINNLHYLNYSDMPAGRITGMTRFASFWVENGKIMAPLNVMRFDESIFNTLGDGLRGLTGEREWAMEPSTYESRQTGSSLMPGAIVEGFHLTL